MEIGLESTFKSGFHIITTIVRLSPDVYDYMRTRLKLPRRKFPNRTKGMLDLGELSLIKRDECYTHISNIHLVRYHIIS